MSSPTEINNTSEVTLARITSQRDRLFKGLTQYIGANTRDQLIEMRGVVKALQKKDEQAEALALLELCLEIHTEIHANENQQPTTSPSPIT